MPDAVTEHGFRWGPMTVERVAHVESEGRRWFSVRTDAGQHLEIYCSPKGHNLRVYDKRARQELT